MEVKDTISRSILDLIRAFVRQIKLQNNNMFESIMIEQCECSFSAWRTCKKNHLHRTTMADDHLRYLAILASKNKHARALNLHMSGFSAGNNNHCLKRS